MKIGKVDRSVLKLFHNNLILGHGYLPTNFILTGHNSRTKLTIQHLIQHFNVHIWYSKNNYLLQ